MNVWVNGERTEVHGARTIAELAEQLGVRLHSVLIEQNGVALYGDEWPRRQLTEDDRIEFVRIAAGG